MNPHNLQLLSAPMLGLWLHPIDLSIPVNARLNFVLMNYPCLAISEVLLVKSHNITAALVGLVFVKFLICRWTIENSKHGPKKSEETLSL